MAQPIEACNAWASWQRRHLELCWRRECDIDPLILRARHLRAQSPLLARSIEEELLPLL